MKIISLFNNKGGVGKSTLAYHLASILAEQDYRVLMIDLDPQSNLTLYSIDEETLHAIWDTEDQYIEFYANAIKSHTDEENNKIFSEPRTIHFFLKPIEDGESDSPYKPVPYKVSKNLDLIPGRLTLHRFEDTVTERWSAAFRGDPLAIRTVASFRNVAEKMAAIYGYDFIIIDTSPSLSAMNKIIISTVDGFIVPALPDMFSLYGIRNIGASLKKWKHEFNMIYNVISEDKRKLFPKEFVRFLGYTIYNAKKRDGSRNKWKLAQAHFNYVQKIPGIIAKYISQEVRNHLSDEMMKTPIGETSVMHTHNTFPSNAQTYRCPIWKVPDQLSLTPEDKSTVQGNRNKFYEVRERYLEFSKSFIERVSTLD